jgi:branched-chain amino acid aminotransferase
MLEIDYYNEEGWQMPEISQYHNFSIDPFNSTLHYAIQLFEGLKAYKSDDNRIILFRPEQNMIRMNYSSKRLSLPVI